MPFFETQRDVEMFTFGATAALLFATSVVSIVILLLKLSVSLLVDADVHDATKTDDRTVGTAASCDDMDDDDDVDDELMAQRLDLTISMV